MLKTVSFIGETISGTLQYQGLWNASTNTPTLTSSVGTLNNYYVVSVAGSTNLNGITNWQVGDWAIFNGTVWERLDGGSYGAVSQVGGNGTVNGITLTGNVTSTGNLTLGGTLGNVTNSQLSNNSITLGNTSVSLGGTASSIGNLTLANVTITSGTVNANVTAQTLPYWTNNNAVATTAFTQAAIQATMSTLPLNLGVAGGGIFSFASVGSGAVIVFTSTGGAINSISLIAVAGSGYQVGDLLSIPLGNGDAILRVATLSGSGVASVQIIYGGTGYTSGGSAAAVAIGSVPFTFTLTGTLTSNATIVMTNGTYLTQSNQWCVNNNTTGAYTVTFKVGNSSGVAIGTGVVIPQGSNSNTATLIQTDGESDIWLMSPSAGPTTGSGNLVYSNNASLSNVTISSGSINVQTSNLTATVTGNATYNTSSLLLVPLGFFEVDLNGTVVKVPYYSV